MNFRNPIFFRRWGSSFGVVDIWWVEIPERHPFGAYAFHRYCWFTVKLFPAGSVQDTGRTADFGSGCAHVRNFRVCFTTAQSAIRGMGCHRQGGDPLYTGPAKKYPLKNFANISITIERYDMKLYTLLTHSIIHKCRKFH